MTSDKFWHAVAVVTGASISFSGLPSSKDNQQVLNEVINDADFISSLEPTSKDITVGQAITQIGMAIANEVIRRIKDRNQTDQFTVVK